ncbi:MAG: division/cell wall cluster transcriptional repressor MraZ [Pirellulaceae bacterium]
MPTSTPLILGEFRRSLDERFRLSLPAEMLEPLSASGADCILTKESPGAISLWNSAQWQSHLDSGMELVQRKIQTGRLNTQIEDVQRLGRLLSTRHRTVQIAGKGRVLVPEGFREFLGVEPGGDVLLIGAAICVEIWRPDAWLEYLKEDIPQFRKLFDNLSG